MLLAIDSGNTNTVFAIYDDDHVERGEWRCATDADRTADEYGVWLTQLMALKNLDPKEIDAAVIGSVVPANLFNLCSLCRNYFNSQAMVIGDANVDLGIKVLVDRPEEVGADRLINAVAAFDAHAEPQIIIDFGTATTFDVVDGQGSYLGGVIAPGINLSLEALHMAAAQLPRVAISRPGQVIGKGTVEAMKSGIFWGYVSMIEGMVDRIRGEFGAPMRVIATGGLADLFTEATDCIDGVDADLTMRGLLILHARNNKTS
ncbi:type III pantothenate kinase [Magnetospira sp. QH-2]|uniref:type III pantothenate kinase n=1 Tax=Magnetospira sp. (strain QH-2) TaxID=1288970 RepID=UPI0003E8177F|nr:type III pantothenate kinase [Magnetospira sp. QH-2]CCQ73862.1 Type III pantothenate kinase [Magnetospira sp. QH-2]